MAREIEYENDEGSWNETPEQRYERVVKWVRKQLTDPKGQRKDA